MLRRRRTIQTVKSLDAFPKTSEECVETTPTGGTVSLISFGLIIWLIIWEFIYFLETDFKFKFKPDVDMDEKLILNVDITVAMPCRYVGADTLDLTGEQVLTFGELEMDETWWELDFDQRAHFEGIQRVNNYLRDQFHSIHEILWRSGYTNIFGDMPSRREFPAREMDACRLHGSLTTHKVAGNFHITAGKTIQLPRGHAHLAVFMDDSDYNFTHRIDKFSYGHPAPGIIHPLEGDEQITHKNMMTYQYFVIVVPTKVSTYSHRGNTFQYSVAEQSREISHDNGSHGTPGIFFKYDVSSLKVEVREEHEPFLQFFTRILGIVGGVFTCSGLLHRCIGTLVNFVTCRYFRQSATETKGEVLPPVELINSPNPLLTPTTGNPLLATSLTEAPTVDGPATIGVTDH
ncbi:endoplasmic reticulum-Golgi intermediate compartment protein 2 [Oratosquilla oratoria]|uniref:endoplasmic reticulum-Golgi intermediate compartment protein 2 n=1 Tax=Oratosquilla oratoria TaxID=337810 RepID=UPI003F7765B6